MRLYQRAITPLLRATRYVDAVLMDPEMDDFEVIRTSSPRPVSILLVDDERRNVLSLEA